MASSSLILSSTAIDGYPLLHTTDDWDNWRDSWGNWLVFFVLSLWPQPIGNLVRRSTNGLTIDWPFWIVVGAMHQVGGGVLIASSKVIQDQFETRKGGWAVIGHENLGLFGLILPLHAMVLGLTTLVQTNLLPPRSSKLSKTSSVLIWLCVAASVASLIAIPLTSKRQLSTDGDGWWQWVDLINTYNTIAVVASLFKFIPQILSNHRRQSTQGFSMLQVGLDAMCWIIFLSIDITTNRPSASKSALWSLTAIMIGGVVGDGVLIWQWWTYRGNRVKVSRQQMMMDGKVGEETPLLAKGSRVYV
nr:hypothetical protein B0A51_09087 [Rachicladosporium sp. CCFEE 5018]